MGKYIDAEKLIAEIERLDKVSKETMRSPSGVGLEFAFGISAGYADVLKLITSLQQEQPEADFEKEIVKYLMPIEAWQIQEAPFSSMANIARHFYELGLNARKEK